MSTDLHCRQCGKLVATLRDARVRTGLAAYCRECDQARNALIEAAQKQAQVTRLPEGFAELFSTLRR